MKKDSRHPISWIRDASIRRPWVVLLLVLVTTVPAAVGAARLRVRTSFSELLPESRPSVRELRRISGRLAGVSTLVVVAEGTNESSLRRFVDTLAPLIRGLGPELVTGVDEGGRAAQAFIRENRALYADLEALEVLRDDVVARYDYEIGKRTGLDLGISDDVPPPLTAEAIERRFDGARVNAERASGGGYYIGEDGHLAAMVVRTPFEAFDARAFALERKILDLVERAGVRASDPNLVVRFTGNLVTSAEEHQAVTGDLMHVGLSGVALILAAVLLYFLSLRAVLALLLTIGVGCLWSFGVAFLTVGYLNSATGFLVSIIAGNGINFGILLTARYLEGRLEDGLSASDAVRTAVRRTAPGTLAAAVTAGVAYGSLAVTDFRGFRHFGIIGGLGMMLCWIASYTLLPALLVVMERVVPLRAPAGFGSLAWLRRSYGRPFAYLALRHPKAMLLAAAASLVLSLFLAVRYVTLDPREYDMTKVRNDASSATSSQRLATRVNAMVGRLSREGRAILTDRVDQVAPLERALEARRDAAPPGEKPFDRVVSAFDLLPDEQEPKLSAIETIRDRARRAHRLGVISDDDWGRIDGGLPSRQTPLGIGDLPKEIAWPFEETDGTRGRILYLVPTEGSSLNDVHYLMRWADSFREVPLPQGDVIRGTGDPVIFSDMLRSVGEDGPKAMLAAAAGTVIVVLFAFRARPFGWLALGSVGLGLAWLVGFLGLARMHINFLNFVALPITVGVGADYAVNVIKRYEGDGARDLHRTLVETGGAVVLCSLTTLLGYGALTLSINGAVRSFGIVGAVGELTTLCAAMLVAPAWLRACERTSALKAGPVFEWSRGQSLFKRSSTP